MTTELGMWGRLRKWSRRNWPNCCLCDAKFRAGGLNCCPDCWAGVSRDFAAVRKQVGEIVENSARLGEEVEDINERYTKNIETLRVLDDLTRPGPKEEK